MRPPGPSGFHRHTGWPSGSPQEKPWFGQRGESSGGRAGGRGAADDDDVPDLGVDDDRGIRGSADRSEATVAAAAERVADEQVTEHGTVGVRGDGGRLAKVGSRALRGTPPPIQLAGRKAPTQAPATQPVRSGP